MIKYTNHQKFLEFILKAQKNINRGFSVVKGLNPHNINLKIENLMTTDKEIPSLIKEMKKNGVNISDQIYMEGCFGDDIIVFDNRYDFLKHFCQYFNKFAVCDYLRHPDIYDRFDKLSNDPDALDEKFEKFFDNIEHKYQNIK